VVNSPGKIGREIGRCRTNLHACLLSRLEKEEKPRLEEIEENMEYTRGAGGEVAGAYNHHQDAYFSAYKEYRTRRREIRDEPVLLVIDESDRLTMASLEQVRAFFDQGGLGVLLIGMPGIAKRLSRFAQLYSRVGFVHEFRPLVKQEVCGLLKDGWKPPGVKLPSDGVTDEEALAAILRITNGNFRLLERLLTQIARVLEINSLPKVTPAVVDNMELLHANCHRQIHAQEERTKAAASRKGVCEDLSWRRATFTSSSEVRGRW
jgi:hypothetical protein